MNWLEKKIYSAGALGFFNWMPDEQYLKIIYRMNLKKKLHIKNPSTFNEKLQWLKIHDRRPEYTCMVDKYEAKKYVANKIGNQYIVPTLGVWDRFENIEFGNLPNQFVLKCTHDSGGLVICKDKKIFDYNIAKKKINKCMRKNYYWQGREWPYKDVPRRIMAEKYMEDEEGQLKDYKFFCFNGKVECFKIDFDRYQEHHANYYDREGNLLPFGEYDLPPRPERVLKMPSQLKLMIDLAERLSAECSFLRVDFYEVEKKVKFGELTFYPASGFGKFYPEEWDKKLGDILKI